MSKIKIVIADDQLLTREGLRTILDLEDDMEVVGAAKNGEEACVMVETFQPDLVLLDVQMPIMNGISALKRIKQIRPDIFILILTTFIETDYIVEGMAFGASGYMLKDMDADKMISSIRDTISGQFILPAPVAAKLATRMNRLTEYEHWQRSNVDRMSLTEREEELAQLIIRGLNNREIADTLHIAEGTARNYISNLYSKLEVVDRAQAIVRLQAIMQP
ncbi:response regulator [Paenibacillus pseudetheri]|uniref:Transcriptional regulatory protein LnrK n=1 Tax=Paenibacillus pseudetheri TaxID=2897682 RepID=A0ABM9BIJ0_9BACL|nr:response regulator transcription factor [Paenibacillus pseudetheri]CAH1058381.1 Transcriptional regulatory protein LnrK [Paenibacillus pseudetheri]